MYINMVSNICMCYRVKVIDAEICRITDINCGFGRISRQCAHNLQTVSY